VPAFSSQASINPDQSLDLSWEMFGELCRALALRVARDYDPELVVGVAWAGVIPGAVVASILRVDFHSMKISRRDGGEQVRERPAILSSAPASSRGQRVLIVDEIFSSGETLRMALSSVRNMSPAEVRTATAFVRPRGYKPDYLALETDQTIIFPWDRKIFQDNQLVANPLYQAVLDE
jgi:hypoxanthine phosphoribosyltransferase